MKASTQPMAFAAGRRLLASTTVLLPGRALTASPPRRPLPEPLARLLHPMRKSHVEPCRSSPPPLVSPQRVTLPALRPEPRALELVALACPADPWESRRTNLAQTEVA